MEYIMSFLGGEFDPATLLPDLGTLLGKVELLLRLVVLAGPVTILVLGLIYFLIPPKEANHHLGYQFFWGKSSVEAWRFTQKLAGIVWAALGIALTVAMVVITGGYGSKEVIQVVDSAITCLIWEIVLAAISIIAINVIVMLTFDSKGYPRKRKNKDAA